MSWTIAITVLATLLIAALAMNFKTPEKTLERKIEHRYAVSDPQFRREMGVLLGPGIVPGNTVTDLENGDEIFPSMLEAIRGALLQGLSLGQLGRPLLALLAFTVVLLPASLALFRYATHRARQDGSLAHY